MITRLRMQNFKSWQDTGELEIAPLTGLFGTNSSGKTSILQMLLMLKQTVESPDRRRVLYTGGDERALVDLGTFFDIIHDHRRDAVLELALDWMRSEYLRGLPRQLSFMTSIRQIANRPVVERFAYQFGNGNKSLGMSRRDMGRYNLLQTGFLEDRPPERQTGSAIPEPVKCYGFPVLLTTNQLADALGLDLEVEQARPDTEKSIAEVSQLMQYLVLAFEALFSRITYLGPLRDYPKRIYLSGGDRPSDVGPHGEATIAALLAARKDDKLSIEEQVLKWMQEMKLIHSFELRGIAEDRREYEFVIKMSEGGPDVRITDVGFGVSQILPVLVLCYYVSEGSIILLEQPEIHLHPSVQAGLADVLIDVVNKRKKVQIIVESHSEHLLTRLQRRIAEEKISPDKTALYFCDIENGVSRAERLKVDEYGNISNWPKNFFGDELGDRVAMAEAAMRRMGAG